MSKVLVSVVVCTSNRADSLEKCLKSITNQSYKDFEIIVVDFKSKDKTQQICKDFDAIIVNQKAKTGLSAARNLGLGASKGDIISFIDDDGVAHADWLKNIVQNFENPSVGVVGGTVYGALYGSGFENDENHILFPPTVMNKFTVHIPVGLDSYLKPEDGTYPIINGCNMSFKKRVLDEIGWFDEYFASQYDDTEPCIRIIRKGYRIVYGPDVKVRHFPQYEGITRIDYNYHMKRNWIYFCIKNFVGNELNLSELIVYDFRSLKDELMTIILKHKHQDKNIKRAYHNLEGNIIRSLIKITVMARLEGYFRGLLARNNTKITYKL